MDWPIDLLVTRSLSVCLLFRFGESAFKLVNRAWRRHKDQIRLLELNYILISKHVHTYIIANWENLPSVAILHFLIGFAVAHYVMEMPWGKLHSLRAQADIPELRKEPGQALEKHEGKLWRRQWRNLPERHCSRITRPGISHKAPSEPLQPIVSMCFLEAVIHRSQSAVKVMPPWELLLFPISEFY